MPKVTIDNQVVEVPAGLTVLQAIQQQSIEVPIFCYHPRLNIAGNCRMCLVEVERSPKPVASCATPVTEGMIIRTNSPMVEKARRGVLEFLLINHPLDCPICDQGGECDLQDITMAYGADNSRFNENKRAVEDKDWGPLVKTEMTRCIHCTRCIRFVQEVAGTPELGATYRGEHMEVGTYIEHSLTSELSGNIIDLCPVGALTSKPYEFRGRPWELTKTETIDVMDAVGSNIRVDSYGPVVKRILPRLNEAVNEEWISDKARFAYDGLLLQRLDQPYLRVKGKLQPVTWERAIQAACEWLRSYPVSTIGAIVGDLVDCETMVVLKDLWQQLGNIPNLDCRQDGAKLDFKQRRDYLFNTTIAGLEQVDACLIIGANPRLEAPLVNTRLRKRWLHAGCEVGVIGNQVDLTYDYHYLGDDSNALLEVLSGASSFSAKLQQAQRPALILGMGALARPDGQAWATVARQIAEKYNLIQADWCGYNVLHTAASRVGGLDLGIVPNTDGMDLTAMIDNVATQGINLLYLLGADEIDFQRLQQMRTQRHQAGGAEPYPLRIIYQGHHGDAGAAHADLVLPGAAYTEKNATYVNLEGRAQLAFAAVPPPGLAQEDWRILWAIAENSGFPLTYSSLEEVRQRMHEINPALGHLDQIIAPAWQPTPSSQASQFVPAPLQPVINNFYMTNVISRNSLTMAKCVEVRR